MNSEAPPDHLSGVGFKNSSTPGDHAREEPLSRRGHLRAAQVFQLLNFALIVGTMSVVFAISLAAIVYKGDLAPFLSQGIGFTLTGSAIMAVSSALLLSYRGTVCQPQDATAAVLSLAAASVAASYARTTGESLYATVATLVFVVTAANGVASFIFGALRLGRFGRFIPYPVIGGFLAASGFLLVSGAIEMVAAVPLSIESARLLFAADRVLHWAPWIGAAGLMLAACRRFRSPAVLPLCLLALASLFYVSLWVGGLSLAEARELALLLGPFDEAGFATAFSPGFLLAADWTMLGAQLPSILLIVGLASLGAVVNATAIEIGANEDIDLDQDLRSLGIVNLISAFGGGMVGYHVLGRTLLARRLGVTGRMAGVIVAISCIAGIFYGAPVLSLLPVGLFAAVLAYLGLDLIVTALWDNGRRLPWPEFLVVLITFGVGTTIGFLEAVIAGLLAATLLFVIAYARLDVIRLRTHAGHMPSRVERGPDEQAILSRHGHLTRIYKLDGYVFFGTAHRLVGEIKRDMDAAEPPTGIIIDFKAVRGLDASAARAIICLARLCEAHRVELMLTGLAASDTALLRALDDGRTIGFVDSLHRALEIVEERLLIAAASSPIEAGLLHILSRSYPEAKLAACCEQVVVRPGQELITHGAAADALFVITEGSAQAEVVDRSGRRLVVAGFQPGALVGEIGLYAGLSRTARVVSLGGCKALRIGADVLEALHCDDPALAADIHRLIATSLARRLMRTTALLRDSDF